MVTLPDWVPMPTPLMESTGVIAFEWDFGPGRFFVLALNGTGKLEYSAIFGINDERFGVMSFAGVFPVGARLLLAEMVEAVE